MYYIYTLLIFFNTNSVRMSGFKSIQANIDVLHIQFIDLFFNKNEGFIQVIYHFYIYTSFIFKY